MAQELNGVNIESKLYTASLAETLLSTELGSRNAKVMGVALKAGAAGAASIVFGTGLSAGGGYQFYAMGAAANEFRSSFGQTVAPAGNITAPVAPVGGAGSFPFPWPVTHQLSGIGVVDLSVIITLAAGGNCLIFFTRDI